MIASRSLLQTPPALTFACEGQTIRHNQSKPSLQVLPGNKAPQKRPLTEAYAEAIADGVGDPDNQLSVALDALHSPI